ncbi:hypothetical protein [Desulfobacter postgatei]|uniref:HEPN domain-containing protein n=1 Tax=Desulfobacter postgatei 2ac9 TaxID=879212 RepID=I5B7P5_9BACT|nr:hypothetical protein [Desulfobacter postgatei]EIM65508.1 hypothetical protein DespoDRAFT_03773 [Desulfobacter postgatei 2ac9]
MTKYVPSKIELNGALDHIYYEISQLAMTMVESKNPIINNALVESRLIHVRALLDFFQKTNRTRSKGVELDDVLSSDYGFPAQQVGIPSEYQERLNKDLAHLTYSRSRRLPSDKPWPHDQVIVPVLKHACHFADHLISSYLPQNCPEKLNEWKGLADR